MRKKLVGIIIPNKTDWDVIFTPLFSKGQDIAYGKTCGGIEYIAAFSGAGKVNAAVCAYSLCKDVGVEEILSFGYAAGTNYDVHLGDIIVGDEYMYYDVACGEGNALGQMDGCPETFASDYKAWTFLKDERHGLLATGDSIVETQTMAMAITQTLYPDHCPLAVDMESAAIAQVCHAHEVPFTAIRIISDNPFSNERTDDAFRERKDAILQGLFKKFLNED